MAETQGAAALALAGAPAPTPTPAAAPAPSPTPGAANDSWYSGFAPELKGVVEKKGWKDASEAIKSYTELERMSLSSDKIPLPKDDKDEAGWNAFYARLGRPEKPDGYKFPEGSNEAMTKAFAPEMHKAGMTQKQVEAVANFYNTHVAGAVEAERQRVIKDQNDGDAKLRDEWGAKYQENMEFARRGLRALGMDTDTGFVPMAAAIGTEKAMKLLMLAGISGKESSALNLDSSQRGFTSSQNEAARQLAERKQSLIERSRNGDRGAEAELNRLYQQAAGA